MNQIIIVTPIGKLAIKYSSDFILAIHQVATQARASLTTDLFAKEIQKQLQAYFMGDLQKFEIPFVFEKSTDFQVRVWDQIRNIPFGDTQTYGEIAKKIKSGPRAIGNACRRNKLLLVVPCHRVVSAAGLGGFMGDAGGNLVRRKQWLLNHEKEYRSAG